MSSETTRSLDLWIFGSLAVQTLKSVYDTEGWSILTWALKTVAFKCGDTAVGVLCGRITTSRC